MTQQTTSTFGITLDSVVNAYRLGMEGQASEHLVSLIDMLNELLSKASNELVLKTNPFLAEALGAIERKNYLWAADMLEYEVAPLLMPPAALPMGNSG
jgi:hypothetical protein